MSALQLASELNMLIHTLRLEHQNCTSHELLSSNLTMHDDDELISTPAPPYMEEGVLVKAGA